MLIALPNPDRSFTATLFLPARGAGSFESLGLAGSARGPSSRRSSPTRWR